MIDDILFVHPNDMQQGRVTVTQQDITTNLPYLPGVHLAFDHHASEADRVGGPQENHIIHPEAPSAARVVYDYYGGKERFPKIDEDLMAAVDKADSAQFKHGRGSQSHPAGRSSTSSWTRVPVLAVSGGFRVPNYELMMALIDYCHDHTIDEILELPDVKERVEIYFAQQEKFVDQLKRCTVNARQTVCHRCPGRGNHLFRQSLHGLRGIPGEQHLHARHDGPRSAEHRLRRRQIYLRPLIEDQRR